MLTYERKPNNACSRTRQSRAADAGVIFFDKSTASHIYSKMYNL